MFERGYCRACGETHAADTSGRCEMHVEIRTGLPCEGSGEPVADSPLITFWRAIDSRGESWIVVSRGPEHARDLMSDHAARLQFFLIDDEIASVVPETLLTGQITVTFEGDRLWRVGTIATEIRR